jgi:chromosome segregation ATPase
VPTRTKDYEALSSNLNTMLEKLNAKNIDTTELKAELTAVQTKITTFSTDLTAYKQALSDAKNADCTTDPAAFKAALQTARTARDKVVKDAADIKAYVINTIKPTLQKIRTQLSSGQTNSNQGSN